MVVIKMENEKFYKNTKYAPQNKMVTRFIKMNVTPGKAIDLGCGAGRDTVYLIKNGWDVLAIDRVDTEKIIVNQLNQEEQKRFRFEKQNFKDIKLETTNLVVANFSIPFCPKDCFQEFWNRITNSILKERIFCWKFLWTKWCMERQRRNNIFKQRTSFKIVWEFFWNDWISRNRERFNNRIRNYKALAFI